MDTLLPQAPCVTHMMPASKPAWVEAQVRPGDPGCGEYPAESLAQWHQRQGLGA